MCARSETASTNALSIWPLLYLHRRRGTSAAVIPRIPHTSIAKRFELLHKRILPMDALNGRTSFECKACRPAVRQFGILLFQMLHQASLDVIRLAYKYPFTSV